MSDDPQNGKSHTILGFAICGCFVVGIMGIVLSIIMPLGVPLIASAIAFGVLVHVGMR
jgi:hypothetical protein